MMEQNINFTPLPYPVWSAMRQGEVMKDLRKIVKWEFQADFDMLVSMYTSDALAIARQLRDWHNKTKDLPAKNVGEMLRALKSPEMDHIKKLLFIYRTTDGQIFEIGKGRAKLFDFIKPVNNTIPGYIPSAMMRRLMEEAAKVAA